MMLTSKQEYRGAGQLDEASTGSAVAMAPSGPPEVSNHFPPSVRDRLVRAAADPNPTRRAMEIDRAIEWGRARYPQGFVW